MLVVQLCLTLCNPTDYSLPGSSVHENFPGYWSWLPFPSLGDLPDPGIEPESFVSLALAGRFFTTAPPGKTVKFSYETDNTFRYDLTNP